MYIYIYTYVVNPSIVPAHIYVFLNIYIYIITYKIQKHIAYFVKNEAYICIVYYVCICIYICTYIYILIYMY